MKRLRKSVILLFLIAMCLFICSCGQSKKAECPFTEITWENTLDEVLALEGEPLDSYPSTYSGTTYIFSKDFHDMSGTIKYMFDDNDRLMSMAWLYIPESEDDLENVYQTLCDETTQTYGESGFDSDMGTAKGMVSGKRKHHCRCYVNRSQRSCPVPVSPSGCVKRKATVNQSALL